MNLSTYLLLALGIFHVSINTHALTLSNVPDINAKPPIDQIIRVDHKCHYPFNASSIITILIFQQKGVSYISKGEKRCAWHFAKEVENTIRDSFFLPNYFKKKLLIDIEKAKKRGESV